jgi:signal transduction histidine kinase
MIASSLDYETTLRNVARALVPKFADWCTVELFEGAERSVLVAAEHEDVAKVAVLWELCGPGASGAPPAALEVLRAGKAVLERELDVPLVEVSNDQGSARRSALGGRSRMMVPIAIHGHTMGVMTCVWTDAVNRYDGSDLETAVRLGGRAGLAIENARRHEELERRVCSRDELLEVVSHDLRTPLAIISLATQVIARELAGSGSAHIKRQLERIYTSVECMGPMIGDLLDISTIDAGHAKLDREDEDLTVLVSRAVEQLQPLARSKRIRLEARPPGERELVRCDGQRISRVLQNLIGNAIKFTSPGGAIHVRYTRQGPMVRVSVRDTGVGIDRAHLPRIFDRHYQTTPGKQDGVGLGLFIARSIVQGHGGHIWADSAPGEGSEFSFTLPLGNAAQPEPSPSREG